MLQFGAALGFLPDKPPPPTRKGLNISFRADASQSDYLARYLDSGWGQAELMRNFVGFYMHVEVRLADVMGQVESFAVREGIALPRENRNAYDLAWVPEAVVRLVRKGLEADMAEQPKAEGFPEKPAETPKRPTKK